jgi:hypothetical protein
MATWAGVGTKIYALKDGTVLIIHPSQENFIPPKGSVLIRGVNSANINITPDDIIMADLHVSCEFTSFNGFPKYYESEFKKDYLKYLDLSNAYDPVQIECARRKEFPEDYVSKDKMEECL